MASIKSTFSLLLLAFFLALASCGDDDEAPDDQAPDDKKPGSKVVKTKPIVTGITPNTGRPGDVITINGTNLSGEIKAKVILLSAWVPDLEPEIVSQDSLAIKFKIPADPIYQSQIVIVKRGDSTANARPTLLVGSKFWKRTQTASPNQLGGGMTFLTFAINGIGYFLERIAKFKSYDPATGVVTTLTNAPLFQPVTAFSVGGKGYALTQKGGGTQEVSEFNPTDGTWTKKAATLQKQIYFKGFTFVIDGKAYVGGGADKIFASYDPVTDQFVKLADYPGVNGDGAGAIAVNGIGYVFGGGSSTTQYGGPYPSLSNPSKNWKYNPVANQWTELAAGPGQNFDRSSGVIMTDGTLIYYGAGYSVEHVMPKEDNGMYTYSIANNTWALHSFAPMLSLEASGFYLGNIAYYVDSSGSFWYNFSPAGF